MTLPTPNTHTAQGRPTISKMGAVLTKSSNMHDFIHGFDPLSPSEQVEYYIIHLRHPFALLSIQLGGDEPNSPFVSFPVYTDKQQDAYMYLVCSDMEPSNTMNADVISLLEGAVEYYRKVVKVFTQ